MRHTLRPGLATLTGLLTILLLTLGCTLAASGPPVSPARTRFDILWRYSTATMRTPVLADGTIYLPDGDRLVALAAMDGAVRWLYRPDAPQTIREAVGEELAAAGGRVVVRTVPAVADVKTSELHVLAAEDGRLLWRLPGAAFPLTMWLSDQALFWHSAEGYLVVSDAATGAVRGRLPIPSLSAPVAQLAGDILVVEDAGNALLTAIDGKSGQILWRLSPTPDRVAVGDVRLTTSLVLAQVYHAPSAQAAAPQLVAFDLTTGVVVWTFAEPFDWFDADATHVYVRRYYQDSTQRGGLLALDLATGAVEYRTADPRAPMAHADGILYILRTEQRSATAVGSGELLWKRRNVELARGLLDAGGWRVRAVSDDLLYAEYEEREACAAFNCNYRYRFALIARGDGAMTHLVDTAEPYWVLDADPEIVWLASRAAVLAIKPK